MSRLWLLLTLVVCALLFVSLSWSQPVTEAQDTDDRATVSALETQVAVLSTKVALQTQVAELQAQVASTPSAESESILYEADWSDDSLAGWVGSDNWDVVDGVLVSSGSTGQGWFSLFAPYDPAPLDDYAVEAEIQYIRSPNGMCTGLGLVARFVGNQGIRSGVTGIECNSPEAIISIGDDRIAKGWFDPGHEWRTYRLEVSGTTIRLLIDGFPVLETSDPRLVESGRVGVFCGATANVRSFKVLELPADE